MIDFEHVSKEYKKGGRLALEDINFHVDEGEFVFLLGHSGAGKSTLLKLILRETLPTSGKVTVLGKDVAKLRRHKIPYLRRQMGIIFQDFRLIPSMTVYENVAFAMHVLNVPRKEIRPRVEYILELVHLEDKAKAYPDTLSGGEQQRVAVARALAHGPKLVIADEPTGNIDPELSLEMMELLERVSETGITVVVVTHEHELVRQFHQRVVTLKKGRMKASEEKAGEDLPKVDLSRVHATDGVVVEGFDNTPIKFAKCCSPLPGDPIVGFITRGFGVSIHKQSCANAISSMKDPTNAPRWVKAYWADSVRDSYKAGIEIIALNRNELLQDVLAALADIRVPIYAVNARQVENNCAMVSLTIGINNTEHLNRVVARLSKVKDVLKVTRS